MSDTSTGRRVAIVTGGSRGIGRAAAERLAADGQAVVIAYASNDAEAGGAVEGITAAGGTAIAVKADIADEAAVAELFDTAEREFGGVDVVVNSAGIMAMGPVADFDLAVLDRMHRTNIRGTFVVNQQAARRVRGGGAVINLSTSAEKAAMPGYAPYAASKGAVEAVSLILARELRGRDITVNAVAPGPVATELFFEGKDEETVDRIAGMNPMERLGTPGDVAEVVSFLAGPARWINGQTVYVNGGMV
ncbi:SDR family oxidoreductase [Actinorugispora endophytica]|uniref:3-oxoacyl-[acyl-carrier protein] reductase n=1 Tax=Actinorugispora endophytica TaxID=1605990 RepID=A0A4R6V182_9ACTN|nr:SDR family oxidoreductase [Actinorugispora endophytica]TDQ52278.1 3-oxoacyl-[acyl-carrier protein] reductase [Actinorugispora endophytica]